MATAEELRTAFAGAAETMADAIGDASGIWGEHVLSPEAEEVNPRATGDAWTPQQAVEHAVGSVAFFRGLIDEAMEQESEQPERAPFPSAAEAAAGLSAAIELTTSTLRGVEDADLKRPAGLPDISVSYLETRGIQTTATVEGVMHILAAHLADHAAQIRRAPSGIGA
jgi:hypothetical protein